MAENNVLLTATLVILGVALFSPSLTGNYQYGNQCARAGESSCANNYYKVCVYDPKLGINKWEVNPATGDNLFSCPQGQVCVTRQVVRGQESGVHGAIDARGNYNSAECIWPHLPKAF